MVKKKTAAEKQQRDLGAVMTPPAIVERMLDMLPSTHWTDPTIRFCEPSVGTGNFVHGLYERLMTGLESWEPDATKRRAWIFEHMIYACDIQSDMIEQCIRRFGLDGMDHHFIVANFLTMDVDNWRAR